MKKKGIFAVEITMDYEVSSTTVDEEMVEPGGEEVVPEQMDTHSTLPTQVAIKKATYRKIKPIASLDNSGSINFEWRLDDCEYLDCQNTLVCMKRKITDKDGKIIDARKGAPAARVDNTEYDVLFANGDYSTFKNLTVKLNGTVIDLGDGLYAHKADLTTRLNFSYLTKSNSLQLAGFMEERVPFDDVHETINLRANKPGENIRGMHDRFVKTKDGKLWYTMNLIFSPIFEQPKYLPPGSKLELRFDRSEPEFLLLSKAPDNTKYTVNIEEMYILARIVEADPEICRESKDITIGGVNEKFPLRRVRMFSHSHAGGKRDLSIPDLLPGEDHLPRRVVFGLLKETAVTGHLKADPYNYSSNNISYVYVTAGGEARYHEPLQANFKTDDLDQDHTELLFSLLDATDSLFSQNDIGINQSNYKDRNVLMGINFTGAKSDAGESFEPHQIKRVSLNMKLSRASDYPLNLIVYAEYDAELQINSEGTVIRMPNA